MPGCEGPSTHTTHFQTGQRAYPAQSLMSGGPVAEPSPRNTPYTPSSLVGEGAGQGEGQRGQWVGKGAGQGEGQGPRGRVGLGCLDVIIDRCIQAGQPIACMQAGALLT